MKALYLVLAENTQGPPVSPQGSADTALRAPPHKSSLQGWSSSHDVKELSGNRQTGRVGQGSGDHTKKTSVTHSREEVVKQEGKIHVVMCVIGRTVLLARKGQM